MKGSIPQSMDRARVTQQTTSSTISLRSELAHDAPTPKTLHSGDFHGPLQWALEGARLGRRAADHRLRDGLAGARDRARRLRQPRARRRAARAAAADAVPGGAALLPARPLPHQAAHPGARRHRARHQRRLGGRDDGRGPRAGAQPPGARTGHVGTGLVLRARRRRARPDRAGTGAAPRARQAAGRQARADHGRGRRGRAGRAAAGEPPGVRPRAGRLPRRGPALGRRGGWPRGARPRHHRRPRGGGRTDRREVPDRRLLLGRRRAREPADPSLPGTGRRRRRWCRVCST